MILRSNDFKKGYRKVVVEENENIKMDFGLLGLEKGESYKFNEAKECIFTLIKGEVLFKYEGKEEKALRNSCFHENPTVLHVPENTEVDVVCISDKIEMLVQSTKNPKKFAAKLYREEDLLCPTEMRGAGMMNEASTRIVRTFFDRSTCPETNFYIGEVVSYPGKWSSYPPHQHTEPEIYFYKFLPENGYGFAEMGDEVNKVKNNDLTGMPANVTHSQSTAPGYAEYYLWVIRLRDDEAMVTNVVEEHKWVAEDGAKYFPEI
jgi:5-deoxy-glucuronate isomerase